MKSLADCPVSEDEAYETVLKEPRATQADIAFQRRFKIFNGVPKVWARPRRRRKAVAVARS